MPQLSDVEIDCLTNSAWVMFDEAAGAEGYIIVTTNSQGAVQTFECNSTSDGTCALPTLDCSQNLTFTLKAQSEQCISAASNAVTTETGRWKLDSQEVTLNITGFFLYSLEEGEPNIATID